MKKTNTTTIQFTPVEPYNSTGQNFNTISATSKLENLVIQGIKSTNDGEEQKQMYIINSRPSNQSRESELFDELLEVGLYSHLCSIQL